jgi:SAM-dependent methyltransferase
MLERARERIGDAARFELGDLAGVDLGETFDAVLMMFGVLSYQLSNADVQAALATARRHLTTGGMLFSDLWYGPAVLAQRPADRVKVLELANGQLIRAASGELDTARQACTVRYRLWRIEDGRLVSETRELHRMRYFFPLELELLLEHVGFELQHLGSFPDVDTAADEGTWNVAIVARAL